MIHKHKAVVLGVNYYIGLSIVRCLGRQGIDVTVVEYNKEKAYGTRSKYIKEILELPHYEKEEEAFLEKLLAYGKKQEFKPVLYPSADPYVEFMDRHLNELKEYYLINQTEPGLWTKVMEKKSLYELAEDTGLIHVPETYAETEENLYEKVARDIGYPCLVKPMDSPKFTMAFDCKVFQPKNEKELKRAIEKAHEADCEVMIQKIIKGFDDHMYTYDAYVDQKSKVTHYTTCHKLRQYPVNFGASVYTEQVYIEEIHKIGKPFLEAIGWKGFAEIELKKEEGTGKFYLIEINVRTTNFNAMLEEIGLNMPYIAYRELTGNKVKDYAVTTTTKRTFWYVFEDIKAIRGYIKKGQLTLKEVLPTFFRKKTYAVYDRRDKLPYVFWLRKYGIRLRNRMIKKVTFFRRK